VTAVDNHYEFLGLEPSATQEEIEGAIARVSEQAITLVYTSPQRSSDLWERIRQMRRDLLATPEGRQVYDEALLRRRKLAQEPRPATEAPRPFRLPEEASPIPIPLPARAVPATTAESREDNGDTRGIAWPYALVAAAAVLAIVASALLAHDSASTPSRRPVAMSLSQLGAAHGSKFVSGHYVTLAWTRVPRASAYRLQVATTPGDPSDAVVFAHPTSTVKVSKPTYHLKVTGAQWYYWRVQALVGGKWQRYTHSIHFAVAKPKITKPVALAPETGIVKGGKRARLCWSPVQGAVGYRLRIGGQKTRTVRNTCVTLSVRPKTYHWSVAALVQGAGVYTGAYSVAAALQVHPRRHATVKSHTHHRSTRRIGTSRSTHRVTVAPAKRRSKSHTTEVAVALPRHVAVSHRKTTRHSRRSSRSKLATLHRSGHSSHKSSGASATHTSAATRTNGTASVAPGPTRVRTTSVSSHRTSGSGHGTAAPTHTPASATAPTKKHTPVVASNVPAPPAPPAPPTHVASAPATAPTQAVSATKAPGSTSPLYVRPVVAPPVVTSTPKVTTPATVPASPQSNAVPANTNPPAPAPATSPVQSDSSGHPVHPEHPDHPVHPNHPAHP
jgi:hypothetical protein